MPMGGDKKNSQKDLLTSKGQERSSLGRQRIFKKNSSQTPQENSAPFHISSLVEARPPHPLTSTEGLALSIDIILLLYKM